MSRADQINRYIARGGIVRLRADGPEWRTIVNANRMFSEWTFVTFNDGTTRVLGAESNDCFTLEYAPGPEFVRGEQP